MQHPVKLPVRRIAPMRIVGAIFAFIVLPPFAQAAQVAQSAQDTPTYTTSTTADLAGNGKQEAISVRVTNKGDSIADFTLTVGAAKLTIAQTDDMDECKGLRVVQVDRSVPARQVIVALGGPDDIETDYLFGFDGSHIFKIGKLDSVADVRGNGAVYTTQWMDFWIATEKSFVDLRKRRVQNVPQPLYYVGESTTATASFPLRSDKSGSTEVVAPGSKFIVVAYTPDATGALTRGDRGWYLIKTQYGVCGWARLKTFQDKQKGLTFAD